MTTLEIKHRVLTTVDSTTIALPIYWKSTQFGRTFMCLTTDLVVINVHVNGSYVSIDTNAYDDVEDAGYRMDLEMKSEHFQLIDESVFMHNFSLAHREIYDRSNPYKKHNATK